MPAVVQDVVARQWGQDLIASWNTNDWWDAPARVGALVARLVGAADDEVLVADSTSVNLFKVLVAAARLRPDRRVLVIEPGNFPADLYIADSVADLLGLEVRRVDPLDLASALDEDVAVVSYSHVDYRTGRAYDMAAITAAVHDCGRADGVGPVALGRRDAGRPRRERRRLRGGLHLQVPQRRARRAGVRHGRPSSPRGDALAAGRLDRVMRGRSRWRAATSPAPGIDRMRCGTPPMVSLLTLEAALSAFDGLSMTDVRAKSLSLTRLFLDLADDVLAPLGFTVATPRADDERGSQVSLRHPDAYGVVQALIARGVVGDYREPDVVRLGFAPLYVRHVDVVAAVEQIAAVIAAGEQSDPQYAVRLAVT